MRALIMKKTVGGILCLCVCASLFTPSSTLADPWMRRPCQTLAGLGGAVQRRNHRRYPNSALRDPDGAPTTLLHPRFEGALRCFLFSFCFSFTFAKFPFSVSRVPAIDSMECTR